MKKIIHVLFVSMLALMLFACTPTAKAEIIEFDVSVSVFGLVEVELTQDDFNQMPFVEATITRTGRDGAELVYQVKGVRLSDVLAYLDVNPVSILLEASDGYSQTYDETIYNDELTILAFFNDGEMLSEEDGPIWLLAGNATGNFWIRQLAKINLE